MNEQDKFLDKLNREISWNYKWESLNRHLYIACSCIIWTCNLLILVFAGYQLQLRENPQHKITVIIALLSTVAITLPILSLNLKWQQRQQVHDGLARQFDLIKVKFETGQLDLGDAVKQFEKIHKKTPELLIQNTP